MGAPVHSASKQSAKAFEQCRQALAFEFARSRRSGRVLQRLQAIEDKHRFALANELRQALAFLVRALRAARHLLITKEAQRFLEKQVK